MVNEIVLVVEGMFGVPIAYGVIFVLKEVLGIS
jgi:hypothetical protein